MSLGAITVLQDVAAVGPVKLTRCTIVGDSAYPAGGSLGFRDALEATMGEGRTILAVDKTGVNGNVSLDYTPIGAPVALTYSPTTGLFTTAAAHGLSAGQAVYIHADPSQSVNLPPSVLPLGLAEKTIYYVIASGLTTTAFKVSASSGGSALVATTAGAGTLEFKTVDTLLVRVTSTGVESAVSNQSGTTYTVLVSAT